MFVRTKDVPFTVFINTNSNWTHLWRRHYGINSCISPSHVNTDKPSNTTNLLNNIVPAPNIFRQGFFHLQGCIFKMFTKMHSLL